MTSDTPGDAPAVLSAKPSDEDIAAHQADLGRRIESAIGEARARAAEEPSTELARPEIEWNLWAIGPATYPPFGGFPTRIVRVGEWFYLDVILYLNSVQVFPGLPSACERISTMACDFQVRLCTMDLCKVVTGPADLNVTDTVKIVAGRCYYVRTFWWQAQPGWEGLYELNITAWIRGCDGKITPYVGFVTRVFDVTWDIFYPYGPGQGPGWQFDIPIKFMIAP